MSLQDKKGIRDMERKVFIFKELGFKEVYRHILSRLIVYFCFCFFYVFI